MAKKTAKKVAKAAPAKKVAAPSKKAPAKKLAAKPVKAPAKPAKKSAPKSTFGKKFWQKR